MDKFKVQEQRIAYPGKILNSREATGLPLHHPQCFSNIIIDTDGLVFNLPGTVGFSVVQAGIQRFRVCHRHLPEREFDDDRRIPADAKLQIKNPACLMCSQTASGVFPVGSSGHSSVTLPFPAIRGCRHAVLQRYAFSFPPSNLVKLLIRCLSEIFLQGDSLIHNRLCHPEVKELLRG